MTTLHITAGDSTIELLKAANIGDDYLPWRDLLHEGPVPYTDTLQQLSLIRSKYIHSKGWGDLNAIEKSFCERDEKILNLDEFHQVILWFEHDLYDQLQLIQILSILRESMHHKEQLFLVNPNRHLGHHHPEELLPLFNKRQKVTQAHMNTAQDAWFAFRANTPKLWFDLYHENTDQLMFLNDAILRMLQELPDSQTGLSKTQSLILSVIQQGKYELKDLFSQYTKLEEAEFLGDWSFSNILEYLLHLEHPLIAMESKYFYLTKTGEKILSGQLNWLDIHVEDKWYGGYHQANSAEFSWCNKTSSLLQID